MNVLTKMALTLGLLLAGLFAQAQKGLNIESIFNNYGKQEGSVLIELAQDVLSNHTQISRYKSLIAPSDSTLINTIRQAVEEDGKEGKVLMESKKNGNLETGYYCLKRKSNSPVYEYILFTNKSKKATLIYIKGTFPPAQLEAELDKLKDLFIKVNNKRIKL